MAEGTHRIARDKRADENNASPEMHARRHKLCTIRVRSNMCYSRRQFTKNAVFLAEEVSGRLLAAQGAHIIHTVSSEILYHIAESMVRASQIRSANSIKGDLIRWTKARHSRRHTCSPATSTNAETYTVTAGDTLGAIAILQSAFATLATKQS